MHLLFIDSHGEHYIDANNYSVEGHRIIYCDVSTHSISISIIGESNSELKLRYSLESKRDKIKFFLEIEKYLIAQPKIERSLVYFSHSGCMLALYLLERWNTPYAILNSGKIEKLSHDNWPCIFNADYLLSTDAKNAARFENENYLPAQDIRSFEVNNVSNEMQSSSLMSKQRNLVTGQNILIVSYFFPPFSGVGSARAAYWKTNIPKLSDFNVDVVTAINYFEHDESTMFVPDYREHSVFSKRQNELDHLKDNLINPLGLTWLDSLESYFADFDKNYSYVILTGNPFFHFEFAAFCKEKWNSKIILDYRDPFANNPFMLYSESTKDIVSRYEIRYSRLADLIVSVNIQCIDLLELYDSNIKVIDINNGYDETLVENSKHEIASPDEISFVYAGSLPLRFNPVPFSASLDAKHHFVLAGRISDQKDLLTKYKKVSFSGLLSYSDTHALLNKCQAGIIFDPGEVFMSTTKIFDYISADLDIIILYDEEPYRGSLHDITKHLSGVYWVKNREIEIRSFLSDYKPAENLRVNKNRYSRKHQTTRLIQCLKEL